MILHCSVTLHGVKQQTQSKQHRFKLCFHFEAWAIVYTRHCFSSLSCILYAWAREKGKEMGKGMERGRRQKREGGERDTRQRGRRQRGREVGKKVEEIKCPHPVPLCAYGKTWPEKATHCLRIMFEHNRFLCFFCMRITYHFLPRTQHITRTFLLHMSVADEIQSIIPGTCLCVWFMDYLVVKVTGCYCYCLLCLYSRDSTQKGTLAATCITGTFLGVL